MRRAANYLYVIAVKRGGSPALVEFTGLPPRGNGQPLTRGEVLFEYVQRPLPPPPLPNKQVPRPVKVDRRRLPRLVQRARRARLPLRPLLTMAAPYPWPVKPFDRQHPVRGFFNDPRVQDASHAFHFGIDVSAPDGTAVYAVTPGRSSSRTRATPSQCRRRTGAPSATGTSSRRSRTTSRSACTSCSVTSRRAGATSTSPRASTGRYVDPIRPGAIHPFVDVGPSDGREDHVPQRRQGRVCPTASRAVCRSAASPTTRRRSTCRRRGRTCRWRPARVRYRIFCAGKCVLPLRAGVDLRVFRKPDLFQTVYGARDTAEPPQQARALLLRPRPRLEQRRVPEQPLQPRGAGGRRARERRVLDAPVHDPQLTSQLSGRSGSITTCSRWNAPIGLSLRPCTLGRRSTSWRA